MNTLFTLPEPDDLEQLQNEFGGRFIFFKTEYDRIAAWEQGGYGK